MKISDAGSIIPENKRDAVEIALRSAFGTIEVDGMELMTGGMSPALIYKLTVNGTPYVLRLIVSTDDVNNPVRQFTCMRTAAEIGVAPRVLYANTEDGVSITDFIERQPITQASFFEGGFLAEVARTLQTIHSSPLFPEFANHMGVVDWFIEQFQASHLLPEKATEEHFRLYRKVQSTYPRRGYEPVSSHNDFHPMNILFDGSRLWVIDWGSAWASDCYVDLASAANFFAPDDADEEALLRAYFGDSLDSYKRARLFLMRQVSYMQYGMSLLRAATSLRTPESPHDDSMETPPIRQTFGRLATGELSLSSYPNVLLLGKSLLNESLRQMKTPRFDQSLREIER